MIPATDTIAMSLAVDIRREHEAAQQAFASAVEHAVRCGELLAEAKAQVRHGEWLPWLAENFPASARTAQGYMRLAAQPNAQALAHLGIEGALRQLAAPPAVDLDEADERRLLDDADRLLDDTGSPGDCAAIAEEARGHVARLEGIVDRALSKFRADIRYLHARGAGIALGYPTWQAFVEAEFPTGDWPPELADMLLAELLAPDLMRQFEDGEQ
ncbi:MAG: DUF3102 domain-containing protein [Solirubrobacteraceae bacterium]